MENHDTNPYEKGDLIPTPMSGTHRERTEQTPTQRPRSRQTQSARDAASRRADSQRQSSSGRASTNRANRSAQRRQQQRREAAPERSVQQTIRRRRKIGIGVVVGSIVTAIILLSGLLYWINRPVPITVNGKEAQVRIGSSLREVLHEQQDVSVNPGNYVTVSGNVLQANQGQAFNATVNGKRLTPEEADAYQVQGTESIDFEDGDDIIEEYVFESQPIEPYLKMEGSGYSIQYISQWARMGEKQYRTGKVSGETAEVVTVEPKDCIIMCRDLYLEGDTKYVALTFDDGPSATNTPQYLDILDRYGVKATFYNLGDNVLENPDLAREVVERGHQLCNHTMAHNQLTAVDAATIYSEITRSAGVIEQTTGVATTHLRPPYGDFTERSWLGSGGSITAAIRWTGDSEDWRYTDLTDAETIQTIVNNTLLNIHSGSILLMHDGGGGGAQDVAALPRIIERLQSDGYQFVTISDLLRAAGDIPEDICAGTTAMPEDAIWPSEIHPDDIAAAAASSS